MPRRSYWHGHRWRPKVPGTNRIQRYPFEQRLTEFAWWRLFLLTELAAIFLAAFVLWLAFG